VPSRRGGALLGEAASHPARRADLRCEERTAAAGTRREAMAKHRFVNPMFRKKNSRHPSGHEQAIRARRQEKLEQLLISESARDSEIYFFSYLLCHCEIL
jgi:hypothetical protein